LNALKQRFIEEAYQEQLGRLFEETLRIEDHLGRLKRINV